MRMYAVRIWPFISYCYSCFYLFSDTKNKVIYIILRAWKKEIKKNIKIWAKFQFYTDILHIMYCTFLNIPRSYTLVLLENIIIHKINRYLAIPFISINIKTIMQLKGISHSTLTQKDNKTTVKIGFPVHGRTVTWYKVITFYCLVNVRWPNT